MSKNLVFSVCFVSILSVLGSGTVFATDGDVTYGAPYLWVNPETGELETVNPGPQPKTHVYGLGEERVSESTSTVAGANVASTPVKTGSEGISADDTDSSMLGVIIAGVVILVIAVGVFYRRSMKANSNSTIPANQ